jgi:hypothetical protein
MLINEKLANLEVATQFGVAKFNEKGETNDLTPEQQAALGKVNGFKYKEDKKPAPAKAEVEPKKPAAKTKE